MCHPKRGKAEQRGYGDLSSFRSNPGSKAILLTTMIGAISEGGRRVKRQRDLSAVNGRGAVQRHEQRIAMRARAARYAAMP